MHTQRSGANAHQALSFDHAETRRTQAGAQLAHVPISPAQLEYQLNTWAKQGVPTRKETKPNNAFWKPTALGLINLNWVG